STTRPCTTNSALPTSIAATGSKAARRWPSTTTAISRSSPGLTRRRITSWNPSRSRPMPPSAPSCCVLHPPQGPKHMATERAPLSVLDRAVVEKAYARWAPVYDAVGGPIFEVGRRTAAHAARRVGGRILEVGVGTGLSFADYDGANEVIGIDLCEPMVAKAR